MLISTMNKGFQMTFENGLTISVQFGKGNYCSNKNKENKTDIHICKDAEICIWVETSEEEYFKFDSNDCVKGWISVNKVAEWIYNVSIAKSINDIKIVE